MKMIESVWFAVIVIVAAVAAVLYVTYDFFKDFTEPK